MTVRELTREHLGRKVAVLDGDAVLIEGTLANAYFDQPRSVTLIFEEYPGGPVRLPNRTQVRV